LGDADEWAGDYLGGDAPGGGPPGLAGAGPWEEYAGRWVGADPGDAVGEAAAAAGYAVGAAVEYDDSGLSGAGEDGVWG